MRALRFLLHYYAYLFHLILALFLFAIAFIGWISGAGNFNLDMIPWASGTNLICFLLIATPIGILSVVLAYKRRFRILFTLWTFFVLITVIWGFFLGPYSYDGMDDFQNALCFLAATILAALGGVSQLRSLES